MRKTILIFGSTAAAVYILFELHKLSIWGAVDASEPFVVLSGLSFIIVGFLVKKYLFSDKPEKKVRNALNNKLSRQEHKVFLLMSDGMSNIEIADSLCIAESTVKTHVSNILMKLNARRRTEAIKIGRELDMV